VNATALVTDTRIHRDVYTDPLVYREELERIWYRTWLLVGHESEIPQPGDFKTATLGRRPVIVCRDDAGTVRVLLNACRHRGALVCRDRSGNKKLFQCLYHAWSYKLDGSLANLPGREGYGPEFRFEDHGLAALPRVATYRGIIFASFTDDVLPLEEHLGPALRFVDVAFGRNETEVIGLHEYEYRGNWKLHMENTIDGYHPRYLHRPLAGIWHSGHAHALGRGHGVLEWPKSGDDGNPETTTDRVMMVFPNMALIHIGLFMNLRMLVPLGHDRTLVYAMGLGMRGENDTVRRARAAVLAATQGPAGLAGADDIELYAAAQEGYEAAIGEAAWLDMSRGYARNAAEGDTLGDLEDETAIRAAYREWRRLMAIA
jgi:benzoate/toluate 1,2-dioxygenase alpha subunit